MPNARPITNTVSGTAQTRVNVSFPNTGLTVPGSGNLSVDLHQSVGSHDVAIITLSRFSYPNLSLRLAYGSPVQFTWGTPRGNNTFIGYVHVIRPIQQLDQYGVEVVAVSAGFPLKKPDQRIWTDVSAADVVSDIASEHGLNYHVETHDRVFPQIIQDGCSQWELLRSLAERIGYSLRVEGTTLEFVSHASLQKYYRSLAPQVYAPAPTSVPGVAAAIVSFSPEISDYQPENNQFLAARTLSAVDYRTGKATLHTVEGLQDPSRAQSQAIYKQYLHETARSAIEVDQITASAAERNRFPIRASATMVGYPTLEPNRVLSMNNLPYGLSGYWTVLRTSHYIRSGIAYEMDIMVGAEGLGNDRWQSYASDRSVDSTKNFSAYPPAVLRQGDNSHLSPTDYTHFVNGPRWVPGVAA